MVSGAIGAVGETTFYSGSGMATDDKTRKNESCKDSEVKDEQLEDVAGGITRENYSDQFKGAPRTKDGPGSTS